jgi:predicted MFS family arabinose efflux permease
LRNAITGITLIAGFASTVGRPLSTLLKLKFGWRGACFTWAALHPRLVLPLNALLPKTPSSGVSSAHASATGSATAPPLTVQLQKASIDVADTDADSGSEPDVLRAPDRAPKKDN